MSGYIGKISDGTDARPVASTLYGTCATAAATKAKVVTCADFDTLIAGVTIFVKFTYANTVASPTLKVNTTDAKSIMRYGTTAPGASAALSWNAGSVVAFTYDGTYWQMVGWMNTDTNTWTALKGATTDEAGTAGYCPAPAKGDNTKYLRGDGTWQTPPDTNTDTNTTYSLSKSGRTITLTGSDGTTTSVTDSNTNTWTALKGATDTTAGTAGYAPQPKAGDNTKYLRGDGTWADITATSATNDSKSQNIADTYIKALSVSGTTITYTKGDGDTGTITTKDTTYSSVTAASGGTATGLVTAGEKYTWNSKVSSPIKTATLSGTTLTLTLAS